MKTRNLVYKIILIIFTLILIFITFPIKVNADSVDDIMSGAEDFLDKGKQTDISMDFSAIRSASGTIYNILLGIGILIALVVGSILGIKFIMASAEDKAKLKEALIPFVVGCIIIFGAFGIWKIAINVGRSFDTTSEKSSSSSTQQSGGGTSSSTQGGGSSSSGGSSGSF